jgi:hypothetical protein
VVSVAASCVPSARSSCTDSNGSSSSADAKGCSWWAQQQDAEAADYGLPEDPFGMGCSSGASSSSSFPESADSSMQQRQKQQQRGRGGVLRRVLKCALVVLAAAAHAKLAR